MNRSKKRPLVFATRDFPPGCGTARQDHTISAAREPSVKRRRSADQDRFVAASTARQDYTIAAREPTSVKRRSADQDRFVAASTARQYHTIAAREPTSVKRRSADQDRFVAASTARQYHTIAAREPTSVNRRSADEDRVVRAATYHASSSSHRQNPEIRNSGADDPIARQKVCEVRSLFKQIYRQLDRDKQARRGGDVGEATRRIDLETQNVIESMGKQINTEKRIGSVPGIKVGDEFQYKSELRIVGLHSKPRCGIDYMKIGEVKLATSIVSSEGYGYNDNFKSGVLIYTGEGGNVVSKEDKTKDQKLEKGNLALANSKKEKSVVRVILGEDRWDRKGKRYIYDGLYTVEEYWREREDRGKLIYKFKLCRIPGQPPST